MYSSTDLKLVLAIVSSSPVLRESVVDVLIRSRLQRPPNDRPISRGAGMMPQLSTAAGFMRGVRGCASTALTRVIL